MRDTIETNQLTTADLADAANGRDSRERERDRAEQPQQGSADQYSGPLLPSDYSADMRNRWESIQTGFVDEPRKAVQEADALVAAAIKRLADIFAEERSKLEHEWDRGDDDISTEDLRVGLRRYRSFFHRLLSV